LADAVVTPRLVLDERVLQANIERVAERVRRDGGSLRPHVKTHKSSIVMQRQLAAGATGITVATVREAEVMVSAGARDVLIAYPPVGAVRLAAIRELAERARIIVVCGEPEQVRALEALDRELEYYWEVESGNERLGTAPGEPTAEILADLAGHRRVRLAGLMTFAGQSYAARSDSALQAVAAQERSALLDTARAVRARGLDAGVLSVGTTPLVAFEDGFATEYRYGNYVFSDATQVALGVSALDRCALAVESTVVARPAVDRLILDAGSKALAAERMSESTVTFGLVRDHPELRLDRLYEEHGICHVDGGTSLEPGDRVEVVPNHSCTCANLHREYLVRLAGGGEARWPVEARGWTAP
jgi:D-serine deaminase-like pyridoxal phosphate-dependent protein